MRHTWDVTLTEAGQLLAPADAATDGLTLAAEAVPATRALDRPRHGR